MTLALFLVGLFLGLVAMIYRARVIAWSAILLFIIAALLVMWVFSAYGVKP